jgi:hypothetical protein
MALFQLANQREVPIPVFAEMGSVNPIFCFSQKLDKENDALAKAFVNSLTLGAGQFCTNPGLIFVPEKQAKNFEQAIAIELHAIAAAPMLHEGIAKAYYDAIQNVTSKAASAGRYGSGAYGQLTDRAGGTFANALTDVAGKLAYQNYADERTRQAAATAAAPGMAEADYGDIQRLLAIGQGREGYEQTALQDQINRYNYEQNLPQAKLQSFLSGVYGAPSGGISTSTQPIYSNPGQQGLGNLLGIAGTGAQLYGAFK